MLQKVQKFSPHPSIALRLPRFDDRTRLIILNDAAAKCHRRSGVDLMLALSQVGVRFIILEDARYRVVNEYSLRLVLVRFAAVAGRTMVRHLLQNRLTRPILLFLLLQQGASRGHRNESRLKLVARNRVAGH